MTHKPTTADPMPGTDGGTSPRKVTVFLSYARADKDRAVQLVDALQAAGLEVWWDTLIEGGAEFARTIEAALHTCDAVVVVWSQASVGSARLRRRRLSLRNSSRGEGNRRSTSRARCTHKRPRTTPPSSVSSRRVVGDSGLIYARNDPFLDSLRGDPRFARIPQSIGFD